jgi:type IV pilus assembly protein PilX
MALLLGLLFLTVLTLLGLSASADAILQSQLAANLRESERAKQASVASLSWAEDWVLELEGFAPVPCLTSCEGFHVYPSGGLPPYPESEDLNWWLTSGYEAGIDPVSGNRITTMSTSSIDPPVWIIELVHQAPVFAEDSTNDPIGTQHWYRILARASGQTTNSISVIESTITRTWQIDAINELPIRHRLSWRELR